MIAPPENVCGDWSTYQALAAQDSFLARGGTAGDPDDPFMQWLALQMLQVWRRHHEAGDKRAILHGIAECMKVGMALPEWLAGAFLAAYDDVVNHRVRSWDEVFGKPVEPGQHLAALRKKKQLQSQVCLELELLIADGATRDDSLFEAVGKRHGIGKTLAKEYFADWIPLGTGKKPRR